MTEKAIEKLRKELAAYKGDQYGNVMKAEIASALERLCRLEPEFAQAVVEGGDFSGCMQAVTKAIKGTTIRQVHGFKNEWVNGKRMPSPEKTHKAFLDLWLKWVKDGSKRDEDGRPVLPGRKDRKEKIA